MHSRPYGDRIADWSLNAEGTVVSGLEDASRGAGVEEDDPVDEAIERMEPDAPAGTVRDLRRPGTVMGPELVRFAQVAVAR